jgi:serine protease Do
MTLNVRSIKCLEVIFLSIFLNTLLFFYAIQSYAINTNQEREVDQDTYSSDKLIENSNTKIAKQITVRISTDPAVGSGVIVQRKGRVYTVLTNYHVVNYSYKKRYKVLTTDGKVHNAQWLEQKKWGDLDLAIVHFESPHSYLVARFRDLNSLAIGETVYTSGYFNWHWISNQIPAQSTHDWGIKAFKITRGMIKMKLKKSLKEGYSLAYSNDIEDGMSGGPILDNQGRLIGINGKSNYLVKGIDSFRFSDNTQPSVGVFNQMKTLSWGIPISEYQKNKN